MLYKPELEIEASRTGEILIDDAALTEFPSLESDPSFSAGKISRVEVMNYGDECFLLKHLLTLNECDHFIEEGEKLGFGPIGYSRADYRSSERISFQSPELASLLWERLKGQLKNIVINGCPQDVHIEGSSLLMQGTWIPKGLNEVFRLCRYRPGGHFAPHMDGYFVQSATKRSLQTFMLYLNEDFSGGNTNFIDPTQKLYKGPDGKFCAEEENILCRIRPESGLAIVFNHNRLHEGEKLGSGKKYILRTDIMFENMTPIKMTSNQHEAVRLFQEADRLEAGGKALEAMELYRKAFKLSPELADSYSGVGLH